MLRRSRCPLVILLRIMMELSTGAVSAASNAVFGQFQPPFIHDLVQGHSRSVLFTMHLPRNDQTRPWKLNSTLTIRSFDESIAKIITNENSSFLCNPVDARDDYQYCQLRFTIDGVFLGKTSVGIVDDEDDSLAPNRMDVWIKRDAGGEYLNKIFVGSLMVLIPIANVMMGCELNMKVVLQTFKMPVAPAIGFVAQFAVMPMLAFAIAMMVLVKRGMYPFALGLFVTGCSPGGGASNFWTILLEGNAHLSVTMTFISTVASLVMMPLWIGVLGERFLHGDLVQDSSSHDQHAKIQVPYGRIITSLLILIVPLLVGVAIARFKPQLGAQLRKILRPFIIFLLIFLIVFGILSNLYMFQLMNAPVVFAGLLLPWCGFAFGCFLSVILRQPPPNVTAIAIETGIQNTGIAIMLLKFSFPEPDSDLAALAPVIVACFTPVPILLGVGVHKLIKWSGNRKGETTTGNGTQTEPFRSNDGVAIVLPNAALTDKMESNQLLDSGPVKSIEEA